jgi:hypothetical protein
LNDEEKDAKLYEIIDREVETSKTEKEIKKKV